MVTLVIFDVHGLPGLVLFLVGLTIAVAGVVPLLPESLRSRYVRSVRGPQDGICVVCRMPTIDGSPYCCEEHRLQDEERKAW